MFGIFLKLPFVDVYTLAALHLMIEIYVYVLIEGERLYTFIQDVPEQC